MTTVFIINGAPRSGKDTLIRFMRDALRDQGIPSGSFSSIDPVREMIDIMGIDVSEKTDADRKLLSVIGDAVEEHSNYRTDACCNEVCEFTTFDCDEGRIEGAFFLQIREPANIEKVRKQLLEIGHEVVRVQVLSKRAIHANNPSDLGTDFMDYNWSVPNESTLGALYDDGLALLRLYHLL